jgi:hypothetical protein
MPAPILLFLLLAFVFCCPAAAEPGPADFATRVLAWNGTGGVSGYNNTPEHALGPPSRLATPGVPDNSNLFSFGWGGFITLGFDRPIHNDPRNPGGFDFIIFGNALFAGGDEAWPHREPGYLEVGVDPSGNHQYGPHVVWYWLKGSPSPNSISGFPMPLPDASVNLVGYADCTPTDGSGDPLLPSSPYEPGIAPGSAGGDAFDISWAVDASGAPVHLEYIDFVRITCAVDHVDRVVGRLSTEIDAVSIVRPAMLPGDLDGDGAVDMADAVLAARIATGASEATDSQREAGDLTGDGQVTFADVSLLLRKVSGLG